MAGKLPPRTVSTAPGYVLVKWLHTQSSALVRVSDRYRKSGTDNPNVQGNADPRARLLSEDCSEMLDALRQEQHHWLTPGEFFVKMHTHPSGPVLLTERELRDRIGTYMLTLAELVRRGFVRRRGSRYRAIPECVGLDFGRVIDVSDLDTWMERVDVRPGEYVLYDKGSAMSIGWPPTKQESDEGADGRQAVWAAHYVACLHDDDEDVPDDLNPMHGIEKTRNFYFFVPLEHLAGSLGFDLPPDGSIG